MPKASKQTRPGGGAFLNNLVDDDDEVRHHHLGCHFWILIYSDKDLQSMLMMTMMDISEQTGWVGG